MKIVEEHYTQKNTEEDEEEGHHKVTSFESRMFEEYLDADHN